MAVAHGWPEVRETTFGPKAMRSRLGFDGVSVAPKPIHCEVPMRPGASHWDLEQ